MKAFVIVKNHEYEASEVVVGVFITRDLAEAFLPSVELTSTEYAEIHEAEFNPVPPQRELKP